MLSELKSAKKAVGVKQLRKALTNGQVSGVFLARDADPALTEPIAAQCTEKDIPVTWVGTMAELGCACSIAVGAAAAGILRA